MTWFDRILLILAGLTALSTIRVLIHRQRVRGFADPARIFHIAALSVLTISGLLLVIFGWGILGLMGSSLSNRLVAVVASLIPFCWAIAVVAQSQSESWKWFAGFMALGLILIILSRFLDLPSFSRIIYPVFHGIAGLTVVILPLRTVKRKELKPPYALVSLGGFLISVGGISLAFLMAGRQLLFFSTEVVLAILAPLLFLTTLFYCLGLFYGDR